MSVTVESETDQRRRYLQFWVVAVTRIGVTLRGGVRKEETEGGEGVCTETPEKREGWRRHSGNLDRCRVIKSRPPPSPSPSFTRLTPQASLVPLAYLSSIFPLDGLRDVHVYSRHQNDRDINIFFLSSTNRVQIHT